MSSESRTSLLHEGSPERRTVCGALSWE